MTDTTLTFTTLASQEAVKLVDDPSKPGWEDFLSSDRHDDEKGEEEHEEQQPKRSRSEAKVRA